MPSRPLAAPPAIAALAVAVALAAGCGDGGGATTATRPTTATVDLRCGPLDTDCRNLQGYLNAALAKLEAQHLDVKTLLASKDRRYLRAAAPACRRLDRDLRAAGLRAPAGGGRPATLGRAASAYAAAAAALAAVPPPRDRVAAARTMVSSYRDLAAQYRRAAAATDRPAAFTALIERARIIAATAGGSALDVGLPCPAIV